MAQLASGSASWTIGLPTARDPVAQGFWRDPQAGNRRGFRSALGRRDRAVVRDADRRGATPGPALPYAPRLATALAPLLPALSLLGVLFGF